MGRRVNDYGAKLARAHPERFGFFATLPLPDVEAAIAEMDRALDTLGADGVVLLSNYHGVYLGDPTFTPLWEAMERRGVVLYVHPGEPKINPIPGTPAPVVDFVMDTTRMAVDMVAKGVMERYPTVRVILSHAGGFLPYARIASSRRARLRVPTSGTMSSPLAATQAIASWPGVRP